MYSTLAISCKYNAFEGYFWETSLSTSSLLLDSTRIDMLIAFARISTNIGKTKEAENYYLQVLEYSPDNFYANYQLARLYMGLDRYADGLKSLDILLNNDPNNAVILRAKDDCYMKIDSLYPALDCYLRAYCANVENASLAVVLINMLQKEQELMTAYNICDTALLYNQRFSEKKMIILKG